MSAEPAPRSVPSHRPFDQELQEPSSAPSPRLAAVEPRHGQPHRGDRDEPEPRPDRGTVRLVVGRSSHIALRTLYDTPSSIWTRASFTLLWVLVVLMAGHQLRGWGGDAATPWVDHGFNNIVVVGSGLLVMWRVARSSSERLAWGLIGASLLVYAMGDISWSLLYAESDASVTPADAFYLGYFPLAMAGLAMLVRSRIDSFELSRWVDGIAAALLVAAPGVILVLEPTIRGSEGSSLVKFVSTAYPIGDIVLLGAAVGVIALAGWHPGRAWLALASGFAIFAIADSIYAVENLTGTYALGTYDFLWPTATLLIAVAAWCAPIRHEQVHAWGWRAIALPVMCQVAPIVLMFLKDEPASEKLLMMAVLTIVLVQIVVSRPRRPAELRGIGEPRLAREG